MIDVGGVYDAPARRFDHHQKGFEEVMGGNFNSTRLSSAGLVYKHFGREIVAARLGAKEVTLQAATNDGCRSSPPVLAMAKAG